MSELVGPQPRILARAEHSVSRTLISENALKVLYRLHRSGFLGYLVGGAVRDLMLARRPKDFDIGTNARPQQVRQLFRNARLIGRRFRLARVVFGSEVVEVATFRRSPEPPEMEDGETSDALAPTPDVEEFGTPGEDAWRRDLTINGLFYNIADFTVIDHVGGLDDLAGGVIRTIGPPRGRFAEDPVRMMRAVEYAARLGFRIEEETGEAIALLRGEIHRAAPARIAYELIESLKGGQAYPILKGLDDHGLLALILPDSLAGVAQVNDGLVWRLLAAADGVLTGGGVLAEETLLALIFLPRLVDLLDPSDAPDTVTEGVARLIRDCVAPACVRLAFSNYRGHLLRTSLLCLGRLVTPPRTGKVVIRTMRQEGFTVAWQLLHILVTVTGCFREALASWEKAVARLEDGLAPVDEQVPERRGRHRRRRRGGRRGGAAAHRAGGTQ